MSWTRGKYYHRNVRIGKRIVSQYVGAGDVAVLAARLDQIDQERRTLERADQRQQLATLEEVTAPPAELLDHAGIVADLVRATLQAAGYHQHKRQWRRRRMKQIVSDTLTKADITDMLRVAVAPGATEEQHAALRAALAKAPDAGRALDLAELAITAMINAMPHDVVGRVVQLGRADALRNELSGTAPSVMERLLIDQVILSYIHLNLIEYQQSRLWEKEMSMMTIEFWERRLDRAQRRYLRAIKTLADVRRLLHLPSAQFNINMPGGQQLNVHGDIKQ